MSRLRLGRTIDVLALMSLFACAAIVPLESLRAQNTGTNTGTNTGGGNTGTNTGGNTGSLFPQPAGVLIDAQGVLRLNQFDPRLTMAHVQSARQKLPPQLARPSKLRKVSLNRLEQAFTAKIESGEAPAAEMLALAGLTRIQYVFFYPDSSDIVIAGPAEGFATDSTGRLIGIDSGRPTLLLEDLVVALRAFPPQGDSSNVISVSIDPTQEGLARMQATLAKMGGTFGSPAAIPNIVNSLRQSLGLQTVTIRGVPATTHFAHVLTEADYRMKLIGIGLEAPTVPLMSYVARLTANQTSNNSLVRWYFVPDYQAIAVSEDGLALQMVGQGVKLVGEDELVKSDGTRKSTGRATNPASRAFTTDFTKKFNHIAETNPIYGQLRNLIDMTIAAAFMQERKYYSQANWDLGSLADETRFKVERFAAPQQVETAISAVKKGSRLITPIGGGVQIDATKALAPENLRADERGEIKQQRAALTLNHLANGQWWWD